ncbi:MAG: archease [Nocardioidaceae bacterium]
MGLGGAGHRTAPHTADLRIEAWAPTREQCIAEAVRGTVETFVDISSTRAETARLCHLTATADEDLLVAALDEMVYLMDTAGEIPVEVEVEPTPAGADVRFGMVGVDRLPQVGAVPKAVSLHELRLARDPDGWSCSVTLDV